MNTRNEYLRMLEHELRDVPEPLRQEWIADYAEHFRMAYENGQPEIETCRELGDPRVIARELRMNHQFEQAKKDGSFVRLVRAMLIGTSLGLFNLIFVLAPFLVVSALLVAMWIVDFAFFAGALYAAWLGAFGDPNVGDARQYHGVTGFSVAFILVGLGIIVLVVGHRMTKGFVRGTARYMQANRKLLRDGIQV
ncbi:DUF1700 domain-containing protein [Paenibacillus sp. PR3]|uniref:DUF1700 domain-containing protein n=1 Tax=Paenibacillus terricola TaxID=2763503 RepID=A0ABR8MXC6_9BACL|nr:DUF1700 domain-containing protein [Paenibacillus terricola]MBD3920621.1 DUF1700 domain-containing protein [Paenibacillus terricola]